MLLESEVLSETATVRRSVGLAADEATVRARATDEDAIRLGIVDLGLGIALTSAEAAYMEARLMVQARAGEVQAVASRVPTDRLGGVWFDFPAGEFVVGVVGGEAGLASLYEAAATLRSDAVPVRIEEQRFSYEDLLEIQASVEIDAREVFGSSVLASRNVVEFYVAEGTAEAGAIGFASANDLPPDAVSIEVFFGTPEDEGTPFGGHRMSSCSSGGWAYDSGEYLLITAGHCANVSYHWNPNHHGPKYEVVNEYYVNPGIQYGDSQSMRPETAQGPSNDIENWPNSSFNFQITAAANAMQGQWVCQSGWKTAGVNHCAAVFSTDHDCTNHRNFHAAPYGSRVNDSGAAVYALTVSGANTTLHGVHKGIGCNGNKMFDKESRVRNKLGLDFWRTW